jgi:hypothetical protein
MAMAAVWLPDPVGYVNAMTLPFSSVSPVMCGIVA